MTGATVSWSPLPDRRILAALEWHEVDWEGAEHTSKWASTDENGFFAFDAAPEPNEIYGAVVWATHPEWEAVFAVLEPGHEGGMLAPLETARTGRRTVRVVDGASRTVAAATVWQFAAGTVASTDEELALRAFFRRAVTDEQGEVSAFSIGAREALIAETDDAKSEPYVGPSHGDVRLTLRSTFTAHGGIVLTDGAPLEPWTRVTYGAVRDGELEVLGTQGHEGGAWGPVEIPLLDADAYRFRLHGGGVVAVEQEIEPPRAGQLVRVDLETIQGVDLWFLVTDVGGEILHDASVEVMWAVGEKWPRLPSPPARKDGYIYLRGAKPGTVHYEATAPGYERARFGPNHIPEPELTTWEVALERAGGVSGRCLFEGEPVTDFNISSCNPGASHARLIHEFRGRADGDFELESLAAGEQVLIAFADGLGQSEPVHVQVVAGATREADLELSTPVSGSGRVVDAVTGRPVADVEVQRAIMYDNTPVGSIGSAVRTDPEGRFTLTGLGLSGPGALFSAPGYSRATRSALSGDPLDFGTVELKPVQRAEFVLPADVVPRGFAIRSGVNGTRYPFSSSGSAVVEDFEAGWHAFHVTYPDGSELEFSRALAPGEDWIIPVPVASGNRHLRVTVRTPGDEPMPTDLWLRVQCPWQDRGFARKRSVFDETPLVFDALPAGRLWVVVVDSRGGTRASGDVDLADQTEASVELELGRDRHRFRVLDGSGAPVDSARIEIRFTARTYIHLYGQTDAAGDFIVYGLPEGEAFVGVRHEQAGFLGDVPVELDEDGNMTLVLDGQHELAVQLADRGSPLEGQRCSLYAPQTQWWLSSAVTDASGTARWSGLSTGNYVFKFAGTGYWPVSEKLPAGHPDVARISVRRLGGIDLELRSAEGLAVVGVALGIRSVEFDCSIQSWADEDKWALPESGLVTDRNGHLRLEGLPSGAYVWTASTSGGVVVGGEFDVLGDEVGEAVLMLP